MPGVYREKICPKCSVKHRKRGLFCSYHCGNGREQTPELKRIKSEKLKKYYETPEGNATKSMNSDAMRRINDNRTKERNGEYILTEDDWMLDIPLSSDDLDIYDDEPDIWR